MATWLVEQGDFAERKSAIAFLDSLVRFGLIVGVTTDSRRFMDAVTLYRFKQDEGAKLSSAHAESTVRFIRRVSSFVPQSTIHPLTIGFPNL